MQFNRQGNRHTSRYSFALTIDVRRSPLDASYVHVCTLWLSRRFVLDTLGGVCEGGGGAGGPDAAPEVPAVAHRGLALAPKVWQAGWDGWEWLGFDGLALVGFACDADGMAVSLKRNQL